MLLSELVTPIGITLFGLILSTFFNQKHRFRIVCIFVAASIVWALFQWNVNLNFLKDSATIFSYLLLSSLGLGILGGGLTLWLTLIMMFIPIGLLIWLNQNLAQPVDIWQGVVLAVIGALLIGLRSFVLPSYRSYRVSFVPVIGLGLWAPTLLFVSYSTTFELTTLIASMCLGLWIYLAIFFTRKDISELLIIVGDWSWVLLVILGYIFRQVPWYWGLLVLGMGLIASILSLQERTRPSLQWVLLLLFIFLGPGFVLTAAYFETINI